MRRAEQSDDRRVTRRDFLKRSSKSLAAAAVLASANPGKSEASGASAPASAPSKHVVGKIALEEHFVIPETLKASYGAAGSPQFQLQLEDIGEGRMAEMDRGGVELCILSLVGPGIQAISAIPQASDIARRANDHLAGEIAKYPARFRGFAALPMQDPAAAAKELTRCIRELKFSGALVNGFSQVNEPESVVYYDLPAYRDFWATVEELNVPFYLHPRSPLPKTQPAYQGNDWLTGSIWGFTAEASVHSLRLMGSGLFDEYPKLKIILGHLGEGLPCNIWRIDNRIARTLAARPKAKAPMGQYLRENFYITTSGNFRTQTLTEVMLEVGADRILYSVDYPFEDMGVAAQWFDHAGIGESDRSKIGRGNASQLFGI